MAGNGARSQYEKPNLKNRPHFESCAAVAPVGMLLLLRSSVEYRRETLGGEKTSQHGRIPVGPGRARPPRCCDMPVRLSWLTFTILVPLVTDRPVGAIRAESGGLWPSLVVTG